ncbi:hypothetical protein E2320_014655, partial [Naja naja]
VQDTTETKQQVSQEPAGEKWNKLRRFLCKPRCDNSTENLKLCPKDWLHHENKCYWISGEKLTWNESRDNCRAKDSELAVLKKEAELPNITEAQGNSCGMVKGPKVILESCSAVTKWICETEALMSIFLTTVIKVARNESVMEVEASGRACSTFVIQEGTVPSITEDLPPATQGQQ